MLRVCRRAVAVPSAVEDRIHVIRTLVELVLLLLPRCASSCNLVQLCNVACISVRASCMRRRWDVYLLAEAAEEASRLLLAALLTVLFRHSKRWWWWWWKMEMEMEVVETELMRL